MNSAWRRLILALLILVAAACRHKGNAVKQPLPPPASGQFESPLSVASWPEPGSWPQFAHDPLHTGRADVDFPSADLELLWQFRPTEHVYEYQPGMSVWSSPVVGTVAGRPLVIAGYCDRNVYAVDGSTGQKAWEFAPGGNVFATPALAAVNGLALVILAATNRTIYALDAATGQRQWIYETAKWSFTQPPSVMGSPTVVDLDGQPVVLATFWNSDRSASRNVQSGEIVALRAADGHPQWRRRLASVPISSPSFARLGPLGVIFVASHHGVVYALRATDGQTLWESTLNESSWSSVSVGRTGDRASLFIGTRQHSLFALDPTTGDRYWRAPANYWIDATPAWFSSSEVSVVVAGSYDRKVYAWRSADGHSLWTLPTGNYAYSSPAVATLNARPVVFAMSWDQGLYLMDGGTGHQLWMARSGPLVWSHAFQGDSLWASPAVARLADRPMVLFPACDGILCAYSPPGTRSSGP